MTSESERTTRYVQRLRRRTKQRWGWFAINILLGIVLVVLTFRDLEPQGLFDPVLRLVLAFVLLGQAIQHLVWRRDEFLLNLVDRVGELEKSTRR